MVNPQNGQVIIITQAPGPYARGLTWDGGYLWNVDFQNDSLYQLIRQDGDRYRLSKKRLARITFTHEVKVYGNGMLRTLQTFLSIPQKRPEQKLLQIDYFPKKFIIKKDRWQQPVAVFTYRNIPSNQTRKTLMTIKAEISAIHYFIFPDQVGKLSDIPSNIKKRYTADGSKYRINDPYIKRLSKEIVGSEKNPYWIARKIFDYVRTHLEYKLEGGWNVAPVVLKRGTGSCSEYSFSFIALARAAGLPARYVGAIVVRGDDASTDDAFHRWPEVYLPGYGWIPIDPEGGDQPAPRDQARCLNIRDFTSA